VGEEGGRKRGRERERERERDNGGSSKTFPFPVLMLSSLWFFMSNAVGSAK
jgi:hypothetical protein